MVPQFLWRTAKYHLNQPQSRNIYYVVPDKEWVTDWVGRYITNHIHHQFQVQATTTATPQLLTQHLIHYGEAGAYLASLGKKQNQRNILIATIFHGDIVDCSDQLKQNTERFIAHTDQLTHIVTSATLMKNRLLRWGVPREKVRLIPLGVDLGLFKPHTIASDKAKKREKLGIPADAFCLGSFQKDGAGWGDGLVPKLEKGPDIFIDVVNQLYKKHPNLFILLTGPARGYVKQGLDKIGVPYRHDLLNHYHDIVGHYNCLDGYLVTSREEGGPKAILEALATKVPLVTTAVGLAPDLIINGVNGSITAVEDTTALFHAADQLIQDADIRKQFSDNGYATIQNYSWQKIAEKYYHTLYKQIILSPS